MNTEHGSNIDFIPVDKNLIRIQSTIREYFNWDLNDDKKSALNLLNYIENISIKNWNRSERDKTLKNIINIFSNLNGKNIVIIGAAVTLSEMIEMLNQDNFFVAADGAVGIFSDLPSEMSKLAWSKLVCIVSDADGGPATEKGFMKGVPIILHSHGDNEISWKKFLQLGINSDDETKIVLTHQIPNEIPGMYNIGGFTDGDRAVCFVRSAGIEKDKIIMIGTRTDIVGEWSGCTDKNQKLEKLKWMAKVLNLLEIKY